MANVQETNINAYRVEAAKKVAEANRVQNEAELAIKAYVEKGSERSDIIPEEVPEKTSDKPEKVKAVGVKKADLLAIAKKEGVEGVNKDSKNQEIADAINKKRGVK